MNDEQFKEKALTLVGKVHLSVIRFLFLTISSLVLPSGVFSA